jgi:hypothetical protein
MDLLHVYVQDRFFFPKTISGYRAYQAATPFLLPTQASFRRCVATLPVKENRQ